MTLVVKDTLRTNQRVLLNPNLLLSYRPAPYLATGLHMVESPSAIQVNWDAPLLERHLWGYHLYHSDSPGGTYSYVGVGFTQLQRALVDQNLSPLTQYYYRVATVDSSGIEGRWSAPVLASTAPGSAPGWAGGNLLTLSEDAGPNIDNLNGWGPYEVLCSSDNLYCFGGDGSDYYDGDNSPTTRGVLTTSAAGLNFLCKSAIYDSLGQKRIIAIATNGNLGPNNPPAELL